MTKNHMAEVAKMLGVELGEEFIVDKGSNHLEECRIAKTGLHDVRTSGRCCEMLTEILTGEYEIIKLPWRPKVRGMYWSYLGDFSIFSSFWDETSLDYMRLKCGCVFRTEEEAIAARPQKYKELTEKEWEE